MNSLNQKILNKYIKDAYDRDFFNGNILIAQNGKIVYEVSLGFADPSFEKKLTLNTAFELASVSKHFTAFAILLLKNKGLLSLNDNLEKYFPDIPYGGIKISNLLTHTSGLPDYESWVVDYAKKRNIIPDNSIIEKFIIDCDVPSLFYPNEDWSYCNTGYSLLARIIEIVSQKKFANFMKEEIFIPCNIHNTQIYQRRTNGITIEEYAYGMVLENGKYILPDDSSESSFVVELDGIQGDGIVNSTIYDLLKWDRCLREGTILPARLIEEMYIPCISNNGKKHSYGLGWFIKNEMDNLVVYHGGSWPGYRTQFTRYIDEDITIIILTNKECPDIHLYDTFIKGVEEIVIGESPKRPVSLIEKIESFKTLTDYDKIIGEYSDSLNIYYEDNVLMLKMKRRDGVLLGRLFEVEIGVFWMNETAIEFKIEGEKVTAVIEGEQRFFRKKEME